MAAPITVREIRGWEILDSRGNPTVEAQVWLSDGVTGRAAVPSGASTGSYEAVELRDKDPQRYQGKGVLKAVANINNVLGPALIGLSPHDQVAIDDKLIALDGRPDKGNLGANALLAVSLAVAKAAAVWVDKVAPSPSGERDGGRPSAAGDVALWRYLAGGGPVSLPVPMFNILNGGKHASNSADIQEFMVVPVRLPTFSDALRAGVEIYHGLKGLLQASKHSLNVGDEGGFAPSLPSNRAAIEVVVKAIEAAGYKPGRDVYVALDVAASEFFHEAAGTYALESEGKTVTAAELVSLYSQWAGEYPIISIEDGLHEDDWKGWSELDRCLGGSVQLVGDDLYVTDVKRIQKGIDGKASNAVLLKPNQIGTLTETNKAMILARKAGWGTIMSHRSGETEDTTIADLAVGWDVGQIKTGAPARSERVAKYNRLLRIESQLGPQARYAGPVAFKHLKAIQ